jgi:hypothetical protein
MWDRCDAAFHLGFAWVSKRVSVFLKQVISEHTNFPFPTMLIQRLTGVPAEGISEHGQKATFREDVPAQPVDATPSAINLFSKGGVHDARETGEAFHKPTDRHVEPLEGGAVVA